MLAKNTKKIGQISRDKMVLLRQCSQKLSSSKSENKKSIAIAQKADRTAYDVQYSCRTKPSTYKVLSTLATIVASVDRA